MNADFVNPFAFPDDKTTLLDKNLQKELASMTRGEF